MKFNTFVINLVILISSLALTYSRKKKSKRDIIPNMRPKRIITVNITNTTNVTALKLLGANITSNSTNATELLALNMTNVTYIEKRVPTIENPAKIAIQFQANLINIEVRCNNTQEIVKQINQFAKDYKLRRDELIRIDKKNQGIIKVPVNGTNGTNTTAPKKRRHHKRLFIEEQEHITDSSLLKITEPCAYVMSSSVLKKLQEESLVFYEKIPDLLEKITKENECPHIIRERALTHLMHMKDMRNQTVELTQVFMDTYGENVNIL